MKFQKKIIVSFVVFSFIIIFVTIFIYSYYSYSYIKKEEYSNITTVATTKATQFEDMLLKMDSVSTQLLSNQDFLDATSEISKWDKKSSDEVYFNNEITTIRNAISNYYFATTFDKVVYFNNNCMVYSDQLSNSKVNTNAEIVDINWIDKVKSKKGKGTVIGLHNNNWSNSSGDLVLSLVSEIQGDNRGFIEVQQDKSTIDSLMEDDVMGMDYLVFDAETHDIIYYSNNEINYLQYIDYLKNTDKTFTEISKDNNHEVLYEQLIFNDELIFLAIDDVKFLKNVLYKILPLIIIISLFSIFSIVYAYITSRKLSEPIKRLQKIMEKSKIEDFVINKDSKISNDEIEMFYERYIEVLHKQQQAELKEKKLSMLQLQAQFDLLQAQINPHFIYNVLNVISYRGIINDDDIICNVCSDLSGILRYSTNTKEKIATIEDEVEYLELYLRLLKYRYEHRLQYNINIEDTIKNKELPKIVLQQIVENSIVHGYEKSKNVIEIEVEAYEVDNGFKIIISDTGDGIDGSKVSSIYSSFNNIKNKLSDDRSNVETEIGGMGLVNTFARLYLLYGENVNIKIVSEKSLGTSVVIKINTFGDDLEVINV